MKDAKVLIIGGASGIGNAVAIKAAALGAKLVITGRDLDKLRKAVQDLEQRGAGVEGAILNAADRVGLEAFFEASDGFDHLVSMAGGFMGGGFLQAPFEVIERAVQEKLFANLAIARLAAPKLRDGGSLVFTSGSGGRPDTASGAIIGNAAISTLVQGLAVELAPKGRANAVAPTWTRTPLWRDMASSDIEATDEHFSKIIPLGRTATIDEVASAYIFLMQNTFITGQTLKIDGGVSLVQ